MTTEKQFAANRQNAKNSTGPRTETVSAAHDETLFAMGLRRKRLLMSWRMPLITMLWRQQSTPITGREPILSSSLSLDLPHCFGGSAALLRLRAD